MYRFKHIPILFFLYVFISYGCSGTQKSPVKQSENNKLNKKLQPPNVLFIAFDDLKPLLGAYGDSLAVTPHLDHLADQSFVFLNNHCQWAVCGPSRASLMTGQRPDFTGVRDLRTRMRDVHPNILTIPQYFKQNGYITTGVGKIYDPRCVDEHLDSPSWTIPFVKASQLSFPSEYGRPAFGYYQNKKIKSTIQKRLKEARKKGIKNPVKYVRSRYKPPFEMSDAPDDAYIDGAIANQGIELLEKLTKKNQPFFLAIGFKRPHLPFVAPRKYWDLYNEEEMPLAVFRKMSSHPCKVAYHSSPELRSYVTDTIEYQLDKNNLLSLDEKFQKKLIHGYYASMSFVDAQFGKILNKLKEYQLLDNTIIVVWGDHGWHLGDHSMWTKHSNFEQATRSPLIIYIPGNTKGLKIDSPTEFVDIFPTLCDLAALETPENLQGKSLYPLFSGEKFSKKYAVSEMRRGKIMGYSFRTKRYRYTVWLKEKISTDSDITEDHIYGEELYDYKNDPYETHNLVVSPEYQNIKNQLKKEAFAFFQQQYKLYRQ